MIREGVSVAVAAGDQLDTSKIVDHKEAVKENFTFLERAMFKDWENGLPQ